MARLLDALPPLAPSGRLFTTTWWYFRACRAAVSGGAGHLSGPFAALDDAQQAAAIEAMLALPDDIGLPDPRLLVPEMVGVHGRHNELRLMNVEATAAGRLLGAQVLLSPAAARGVLPNVLASERVAWKTIEVDDPASR